MGVMRHSEVAYEKTLGLIAKTLREDSEQVTQDPLPKRWVDLILHLDEQERRSRADSQPAACEEIRVIEAELAVGKHEKVLRELMRTDEPTEEATTLLKDLRQKIARAVAERN